MGYKGKGRKVRGRRGGGELITPKFYWGNYGYYINHHLSRTHQYLYNFHASWICTHCYYTWKCTDNYTKYCRYSNETPLFRGSHWPRSKSNMSRRCDFEKFSWWREGINCPCQIWSPNLRAEKFSFSRGKEIQSVLWASSKNMTAKIPPPLQYYEHVPPPCFTACSRP